MTMKLGGSNKIILNTTRRHLPFRNLVCNCINTIIIIIMVISLRDYYVASLFWSAFVFVAVLVTSFVIVSYLFIFMISLINSFLFRSPPFSFLFAEKNHDYHLSNSHVDNNCHHPGHSVVVISFSSGPSHR